ncbi:MULTISPECIES: adenine deaminase [unclassified Paracoccus (in: a-proteobacteria)]|uniref:adenine deaminase n=1 Tax=unclassified Paracoccus (in: a-proteobacteria) TaxID=2688777 RepID=UPI0012B1A6E0|nr:MULTISPECIES: adenine deaminase [unclassified Paracoccus (in: a-proteobacteria)]UXU74922.1 adenine deaminase [Paracoccus sp. SMMA_5]UXU80825.1 adenine deaminase [Paracoccus sp. SMMA_5_TC]
MLKPWIESQPRLVEVAAGRAPADLVIRGGRWVNVHSREVIADTDIAIADGRVAYVGPDAGPAIGPQTEVIEAAGRFMVPGLIDAHMHVESGMLTPAGFAGAVIPHGTTTIFHDPHEVANVLGLEGVRLMRDESLLQPISMFTQMPSCAPSAPGLETTGAPITEGEVAQAMGWDGIIGLGEMMNFPAVAAGDRQMLAEIAATRAAGKTVGGHYASPDLGRPFHAYVAGGAADDHETTSEAQGIARVRQGMGCMMRYGSAWYDVEPQITAITEKGLDPRFFILCTDDSHSGTLVNEGHMNRVVRHAIDCGCDPLVAIQMATINAAQHFGLERELGSITPGRRADVILTSDLRQLPIELVVAQGQVVARDGQLLVDCPRIDWPARARDSVHLGKTLTAQDFQVRASGDSARVRVIGVVENQAPTRALQAELPIRDGVVEGQGEVCQIALVERHRGTGSVVNGFVSGFGYQGRVAVASTVAHDSHHMIVVGTDRDNMAAAANHLGAIGGGVTVFRDGAELATVALPIAGLMSDRPAAEVAVAAQAIVQAMRDCGCTLNNAYMQHSLLALVVIPELRISDLGIVDVREFRLVDLIVPGPSPDPAG